MTRQLRNELAIVDRPDGTRIAYVLPIIPEDAAPEVREGLARRRIAALTDRCPCGTQGLILTRQQRRARERARAKGCTALLHAAFEHEPDCLAVDDNLLPHLRAWATNNQDRS
jgi:hypothetical protein